MATQVLAPGGDRGVVPDLGLPVYQHCGTRGLHEFRQCDLRHGAYIGPADPAVFRLRRSRLVPGPQRHSSLDPHYDGTRGYKSTLNQLTAPLNDLADIARVGWLKIPISLGAMISFFSLSLSCMNAGARILYPMGRHGVFPTAIGSSHETHKTPHVAVTVMAALMFVVATGLILWHNVVVDVFGYAGTFGAFGFLFAYFLITIATPAYLKKIGELKPGHIALAAVTLLLLLVPAIGSVYTNPPLAAPVKYFPYVFLGYFTLGIAWFLSLRMRSPETINDIERDIEATHGRFGALQEEGA